LNISIHDWHLELLVRLLLRDDHFEEATAGLLQLDVMHCSVLIGDIEEVDFLTIFVVEVT
jgi:hypothetical protein